MWKWSWDSHGIFEIACLKKEENRFGCLVTFWFGTFICATRRLIGHENTQRCMVRCLLRPFLSVLSYSACLHIYSLPTLYDHASSSVYELVKLLIPLWQENITHRSLTAKIVLLFEFSSILKYLPHSLNSFTAGVFSSCLANLYGNQLRWSVWGTVCTCKNGFTCQLNI